MAARAIARRIRLTAPHYLTLGHILSAAPLIATVPERLALRIAEPFDLVWRPHPVPSCTIASPPARLERRARMPPRRADGTPSPAFPAPR
jgi:hypothetical protein